MFDIFSTIEESVSRIPDGLVENIPSLLDFKEELYSFFPKIRNLYRQLNKEFEKQDIDFVILEEEIKLFREKEKEENDKIALEEW